MNLDHLKVFGCEAYVHQSIGKLDPRSMKCVFVGYQDGTKGCRLWDRSSGGVEIIISRDVIFNEIVFPCRLENLELDPKPSIHDDFLITGNTQFQVEQPIGMDDLLAAPVLDNPSPGSDPTSDHESDREEQTDVPEAEVKQHNSYQQDLRDYQLA